jgi:predicted ATP-dependent endonuclease of OLD family
MKLTSAEITNYRSIKQLTIDFLHGCEILIGINESGKSNILKALQTLEGKNLPTIADLRIGKPEEDLITTGQIRFSFKAEQSELIELTKKLASNFLKQQLDIPLIEVDNKTLSFKEFIHLRNEALYRVDFPDEQPTTTYWALPKNRYKIIDGWKRISSPNNPIVFTIKDKNYTILDKQLVQTKDFPEIDQNMLTDVSAEELNSMIGSELAILIKEEIPKCIYWKYSENYLLPSSVNINEFASNPETCLPLKSMFELAGINSDSIGTTITTTKLQPQHRYLHLLDRVGKAATNHIHDVWKEHKGVQVSLIPNGDLLIPIVKDQEIPLDMSNRSDGFKRFVSFLLLISAKVKTEQLSGNLILVDEPEIGLHPKGARSLMNELISIGKTNTVVFSTHSIFMVDKDNIDRHIIVEKKDEATTTWRAEKSRIQDEDVIYSAIGYSIFETLQYNNVIFEGWRDKKVFSIAKEALIKEEPQYKKKLDLIGLTFAEGVKDIKHVTRFLELANRRCLIISDADAPALQWQKQHQRENGWGIWKTLSEVLGSGKFVTAEDLLTVEALIRRTNMFRKQYPELVETTPALFNSPDPTQKILDSWLTPITTQELPIKQLQDELKNFLFDKLKKEDVNADAIRLAKFIGEYNFT